MFLGVCCKFCSAWQFRCSNTQTSCDLRWIIGNVKRKKRIKKECEYPRTRTYVWYANLKNDRRTVKSSILACIFRRSSLEVTQKPASLSIQALSPAIL
jgi:hypothetical protein